jgi:hypothetical protein
VSLVKMSERVMVGSPLRVIMYGLGDVWSSLGGDGRVGGVDAVTNPVIVFGSESGPHEPLLAGCEVKILSR